MYGAFSYVHVLVFMRLSSSTRSCSPHVCMYMYSDDFGMLDLVTGIFKDIHNITSQRNILAYEYGNVDDKIDWVKIWKTINEQYPDLEAALDDAIKELDAVDQAACLSLRVRPGKPT